MKSVFMISIKFSRSAWLYEAKTWELFVSFGTESWVQCIKVILEISWNKK